MSEPRGLRLNNPGNLRHSSIVWQGQAPEQPDPEFVAFTAPIWGLRALALTLLNYKRLRGLNDIREIIGRWAPPSDNNDTTAYVTDVCGICGVGPDALVDLGNPAFLARITAAIVHHECGEQPYPSTLIANAVTEAMEIP